MKINKEIISKLNPCEDRFDNYVNHYADKEFDLKGFLELENITYNDKVWVVTKLFSKEQNIMWSIMCAESVLHFFEDKYPEDKRPRQAIDEAKNWLKDGYTARSASASAAYAVYAEPAASAAYAVYAEPAASAARSAEYAARSASVSAAYAVYAAEYAASAAYAAEYAARSAEYAAEYAARSAEYAAYTAERDQEIKNLSFMLICEDL